MADIVTAIVDLLKADMIVAALTAGRVFGGELPATEAQFMPRNALVVQPSGGVPFQPAARLNAEAQRLDIIAYGATPKAAADLREAAAGMLVGLSRVSQSGQLVHWAQSAGGYQAGRDRDGQWPYAFQSFQILSSKEAAA